MSEFIGSCTQAKEDLKFEAPDCCSSCHSDEEEFGMQMLDLSLDDKDDSFYSVCCVVATAWEEEKDKRKLNTPTT